MFDVAPTELLLVAIVALLVIGPKDLPKAMRFVGHWVGKARGVARQFRSGFDTMVREAELQEMEKKWAEENARIMREHPLDASSPPAPALSAPEASAHHPAPSEVVVDGHAQPHADGYSDFPSRDPVFGTTTEPVKQETDEAPAPVMVEKPVVEPAADHHATPASGAAPVTDKAPS